MAAFDNLFVNRVLHKTLWAILLPLCLLWSATDAFSTRSASNSPHAEADFELPTHWEGVPVRPMALTEVERRFAQHFPGTIARMTAGEQVLVLRTVHRPTRMLHPATDCYKGLGYRISDEKLEAVSGRAARRCFVAERAGRRLRVCEHIEDAQGQVYTDTSGWYWSALTGQSSGPWRAVTIASPR